VQELLGNQLAILLVFLPLVLLLVFLILLPRLRQRIRVRWEPLLAGRLMELERIRLRLERPRRHLLGLRVRIQDRR
jgi:hypothetical protein